MEDARVRTAPQNIVELRRVLAEKFPGVRMTAEPRARLANRWETAVPPLDAALEGGLAKSAMTELVTTGVASGSSLLIAGLLAQASERGEWLALIDAADSFDAAGLDNSVLQRFLWLRCGHPRDAIKAADLVLHDGTPTVAVIDFAFSPLKELRRIPSSTWFRLERLVENASTAALIITPEPMITNAQSRLRLEQRFSLDSLDQPREILLDQLSPATVKTSTRIVKIA